MTSRIRTIFCIGAMIVRSSHSPQIPATMIATNREITRLTLAAATDESMELVAFSAPSRLRSIKVLSCLRPATQAGVRTSMAICWASLNLRRR